RRGLRRQRAAAAATPGACGRRGRRAAALHAWDRRARQHRARRDHHEIVIGDGVFEFLAEKPLLDEGIHVGRVGVGEFALIEANRMRVLQPAANALPINGSTDIIAQVIRASGSPPHEGTHITFTTTLGTIQPSEADTDINGRAVVKFVASGGSGTATITASSGGVGVAAANVVKIAVGAAAVGGLSVNASPQTLPSSGGTATITATVIDTGGNTLPGVPVTFSIEPGTATTSGAGSLSATVVTTDATGRAATQLTTTRTTT